MLRDLNKVALKYLVYSREPLSLDYEFQPCKDLPAFSLSRGPRPEGGALVTMSRPMVPCAPALPLAGRLGSLFKLRRLVVARFPGRPAEARSLI